MGQQYFPIYTTIYITRFVEDVIRKDEDEKEKSIKEKFSWVVLYILYVTQ